MNTLKRQGSYKTQYKLVSGFLRGDKYTALTANTLLDTTRLTNNVIQCERDGLEIVHIEIPNNGKRPYMQCAIKETPENIKKAIELVSFYAIKAKIREQAA